MRPQTPDRVAGRVDWEQRDLPAPHARVIPAGMRTGDQLGPGWWRMAARLGLSDTTRITVLADGAKWIWNQVAEHLGGAAGLLDIYHASEHLWAAANRPFGDRTAEVRAWVERRRDVLLRSGVSGLSADLDGAGWAAVRDYFEPHEEHTGSADRLRSGQSIGSGLVEGACKQVVGRRLKQTGAMESPTGGSDGHPVCRPSQRPMGHLLERESVNTTFRYCTP